MGLDIDLDDPRVQQLLGPAAVARGKERELVHVAGDAVDPDGNPGAASTYMLSKSALCHPRIWYRHRGLLLEADVYQIPGEPLTLHLICPQCHHNLRIAADRKRIEIDLRTPPPAEVLADLPPAEKLRAIQGGTISVETFECTWETADAGKHVPGLVGGGMSLCKWRVAIDRNIARDA